MKIVANMLEEFFNYKCLLKKLKMLVLSALVLNSDIVLLNLNI